jgi:hypothetical protein
MQSLLIKLLNMEISKYNPQHKEALLSALCKDASWNMFTREEALDAYKSLLKDSVTYVSHNGSEFLAISGHSWIRNSASISVSYMSYPIVETKGLGVHFLNGLKTTIPI